jgi:hypothetical protein
MTAPIRVKRLDGFLSDFFVITTPLGFTDGLINQGIGMGNLPTPDLHFDDDQLEALYFWRMEPCNV